MEFLTVVVVLGFGAVVFYLHTIAELLSDEFSYNAMTKPLSFRKGISDALQDVQKSMLRNENA